MRPQDKNLKEMLIEAIAYLLANIVIIVLLRKNPDFFGENLAAFAILVFLVLCVLMIRAIYYIVKYL
ncbi:MAG: hypothetical protein NTW46_03415 [Candidatus Nealsonbacteria bacterium]|nr:hypothetical protein [Candidatus Nealsonbacteria bacterium]